MDPVKAQANLMQSTEAHFNGKLPAGVHQLHDDRHGYVGIGTAIFASLSILRMSLTYVMPFGSLMKCI